MISPSTVKFFTRRAFNNASADDRIDIPGPISESQERFLDCRKQVAVALGGNGSGKSECGAQWMAGMLRSKPPRFGCPAWIVGTNYEMACGIAWGEKLSRYVSPSAIRDYVWYDAKRRFPSSVILRNGWVIEIKSAEQGRAALQGRSIGMCWIDEQIDEYLFEEVYARTRDYKSPIRYTLTPLSPDGFLENKFQNPPDSWEFFRFDIDDNRASRSYRGKRGKLDDKWVDSFASGINEAFRATRLRGEFAAFSGTIFSMFSRALHVVAPRPESWINAQPTWICSIDWGFTNPFCMLWATRDADGDIFVFHEEYHRETLASAHLARAVRLFRRRPLRTWADPENAEDRAVFAQGGWPTNKAKKDVWPSIEAVTRWLTPVAGRKPRLLISSDCVNLIREIQNYRVPPASKRLGVNIREEPLKKDDHAVDALRYLIYNEQWRPTGESVSAGYREPSWRENLFMNAGMSHDSEQQ